jgi:hypothetical protein
MALMFLVMSNKAKQLLYCSYVERVGPDELKRSREDIQSMLAEMQPGFRVLVDLSRVESIDIECVPEIGWIMELVDRSGVGMVVRVIPNPQKDIGMNILTHFHYRHPPRMVTCASLTEAAKVLSI